MDFSNFFLVLLAFASFKMFAALRPRSTVVEEKLKGTVVWVTGASSGIGKGSLPYIIVHL